MQWVVFASTSLELEELYFAVQTSIGTLDNAIQEDTGRSPCDEDAPP